MAITPRDVRNQQFNTTLRGYDATDVRDYLEEVARELEKLRHDKNELTSRLRGANERLKGVAQREHNVQGVLESVEKAGKDRLAAAQSKAGAIITQANADAEEILMRARRQREDLQNDIAKLEAQRERFHAELKAQLRAHADLLVRTGGSADHPNPFEGYEVSAVTEILDGPTSVDVDLGGRRTKARDGANGGGRRRLKLRRSSDRVAAKPAGAEVAN